MERGSSIIMQPFRTGQILHWLLCHYDLGHVNASVLASAFVCTVEILILTSERGLLFHEVYTWYGVSLLTNHAQSLHDSLGQKKLEPQYM